MWISLKGPFNPGGSFHGAKFLVSNFAEVKKMQLNFRPNEIMLAYQWHQIKTFSDQWTFRSLLSLPADVEPVKGAVRQTFLCQTIVCIGNISQSKIWAPRSLCWTRTSPLSRIIFGAPKDLYSLSGSILPSQERRYLRTLSVTLFLHWHKRKIAKNNSHFYVVYLRCFAYCPVSKDLFKVGTWGFPSMLLVCLSSGSDLGGTILSWVAKPGSQQHSKNIPFAVRSLGVPPPAPH